MFPREEIEQSIPARFEKQVARYGLRPAVSAGNCELSYAELNSWANRIAHTILQSRGGAPEPVALLIDQGAAMIAAILGALKAGKTYVPLDLESPPARIAAMLEHSQVKMVVADQDSLLLAREAASARQRVLCADATDPDAGAANPGLVLPPEAPAYIFYTSGSTGEPKGVVNNHRNVLHNIMRYTNGLGIGAEDRLTLLQRPSFHGTVSNIFCALLNGGMVCAFRPWQASAAGLAEWVLERQPTVWHSVPTLFRRLCSTGRVFPSLRIVRLEGDRGSPGDARLLRKHFAPGCLLIHGLASTETGITTRYVVSQTAEIHDGVLPIGYPVEDIEVMLLGEDGERVRPGEAGEIAVRSRYLATGYWRQPELSARCFRPDAKDSETRIYHTGDLGRARPDGCLEHLGRKDFQVKVEGNTIDVAEIEAVLCALEGIEQAAVAAVGGRDGEKRLAAYIVPAGKQAPTVSAIRHWAAARLPSYMIPSTFVELQSLPLNANGKLDRGALPVPDRRRPRLDKPYVAPRTPAERDLCSLWTDVLGLEQVGIDDDFFELGGRSIDAGRLLAAAGFSLEAFLDATTIRAMAVRLETTQEPALQGSLLTPIQPAGTVPPLFCVPGHTGDLMGFASLARRLPGQPVYGLRPPDIGKEGRAYSLEELAARYLSEIRKVQPRSPYLLCGVCLGGWAVYEMARQLAEQGESVPVLAMLDCYHDIWIRGQPAAGPLPQRLGRLGRRMVSRLRTVARLGPAGSLRYLRERVSAAWEDTRQSSQLRKVLRHARQGRPLPEDLRQPGLAGQAAVSRYAPRPYRGRALLLAGTTATARRAGAGSLPLMGWDGLLVGEVETETIASDYRGLLAEPAVAAVARRLLGAVGSATGSGPQPNSALASRTAETT